MANRETSILKGTNVYLRNPLPRDGEEFIALNRKSRKLHRGFVSPPTSPAEFEAFLERSRQPNAKCFLICRVSDKAILGAINLSQIFMGGFRSAYLGYYIGGPFAGQGYMSEALQLVLRYAFKQLKLHRLEANVQSRNLSSIALIKRAGLVREGYSRRYLKVSGKWRDHERWAILSEDWLRSRGSSA